MQLGAMNFRKHRFWVDDSPNYRGFLVCSLVFCIDPTEKEQVGNGTDPAKEHLVTRSNTWLVSKHQTGPRARRRQGGKGRGRFLGRTKDILSSSARKDWHCPQGRICWSTPCRKNDDKRRSFLHQNRYNLAKGHKFTWPIPLFEDCLAQSSRNQNQAFRYRKWIEVVLYIFRSHDISLLWIWINTNALVVDLFPN